MAELSNLSKSYISQVKNGKRPPSDKLIKALQQSGQGNRTHEETVIFIELFLKSRREGISQGTQEFYRKYLTKAIPVLALTPSPRKIHTYLDSLTCSIGGKHAYFRAISVFYNWLYHPRSGFDFRTRPNPVSLVAPLGDQS